MTAPKLPEGLEPVAWRYKVAQTTHLCTSRLDHYFSNDEGETYIKGEPLVRLSDAQAALQALAAEKDAEIEALKLDAKRLDHLQSRGATVEILPDGSWWKFRIGGLHGAQSPNIRAAIDSAIALAAKEAK